jgi:hypothetical protein
MREDVARAARGKTEDDAYRPRRMSTLNQLTPVTFPSGWLKLLTSPARTGSAPLVNTIGIVVVSDFATRAELLRPAALMSTRL